MDSRGAKRRLGRGLEALLGPSAPADDPKPNANVGALPVAAIGPNPFQPRSAFDEQALEELKQSLETSGLLQPVVVRPSGDGKYELIAGERRLRAATQLGWEEIGAVVRDVDDRTLLTLALVENLQRDSLSPIDEALGYERLVGEFGASQTEVGEMVGRNRSTVANAMRLLRLPEPVQELVHAGRLSTGHARALLQVSDQRVVPALAERAVTDGMSVRELEALARGKRAPKRRPRSPAKASAPDGDVRRVEETLRRRLGTDVFVAKRSKNSGRVTINFYSNDDLARILGLILGQPYDG